MLRCEIINLGGEYGMVVELNVDVLLNLRLFVERAGTGKRNLEHFTYNNEQTLQAEHKKQFQDRNIIPYRQMQVVSQKFKFYLGPSLATLNKTLCSGYRTIRGMTTFKSLWLLYISKVGSS
jgi:hypothetical protein